MIQDYDEEFRADLIKVHSLYKSFDVVGDVNLGRVFKLIEKTNDYDNQKSKMYHFKRTKSLAIEILIMLTVVFVVLSAGFAKSAVGILICYILLMVFLFRDQRKSVSKTVEKIDNIRIRLIALKEAWGAANSKSISLTYIKEKVAAAESFGYRYPSTFHALLASTISKYGNSISVADWANF